jgi:hypothetical protein
LSLCRKVAKNLRRQRFDFPRFRALTTDQLLTVGFDRGELLMHILSRTSKTACNLRHCMKRRGNSHPVDFELDSTGGNKGSNCMWTISVILSYNRSTQNTYMCGTQRNYQVVIFAVFVECFSLWEKSSPDYQIMKNRFAVGLSSLVKTPA